MTELPPPPPFPLASKPDVGNLVETQTIDNDSVRFFGADREYDRVFPGAIIVSVVDAADDAVAQRFFDEAVIEIEIEDDRAYQIIAACPAERPVRLTRKYNVGEFVVGAGQKFAVRVRHERRGELDGPDVSVDMVYFKKRAGNYATQTFPVKPPGEESSAKLQFGENAQRFKPRETRLRRRIYRQFWDREEINERTALQRFFLQMKPRTRDCNIFAGTVACHRQMAICCLNVILPWDTPDYVCSEFFGAAKFWLEVDAKKITNSSSKEVAKNHVRLYPRSKPDPELSLAGIPFPAPEGVPILGAGQVFAVCANLSAVKMMPESVTVCLETICDEAIS